MALIERWTLYAHHAFDRELTIKSGRLPDWRSETRMVLEADYEALAQQLAGAVDRATALEKALTEAVGIVSGGRRPGSALNAKADEWRALLWAAAPPRFGHDSENPDA